MMRGNNTAMSSGKIVSAGRSLLQILIITLLPILLVIVLIGSYLFHFLQKQLHDTEINAMNLFASQIELRVQEENKYLGSLTEDIRWAGIRFPVGSKEYAFAKTNLARELQLHKTTYAGIADGIYCYFPGSGEQVNYHRENIGFTGTRQIETLLPQMAPSDWYIRQIGEKTYLVQTTRMTSMAISLFISLDNIEEEWRQQAGRDLAIHIVNRTDTGGDIPAISRTFLSDNIAMRVSSLHYSFLRRIPVFFYMIFAVLSIMAVVSFVTYRFLHRRIAVPLSEMEKTIHSIESGNNDSRMRIGEAAAEISTIQLAFNHMMDALKNYRIQTYELELENKSAMLLNLQLQINPHLLLNSLNTIYGLAELEDFQSIQKFSMNLVKYFRYSLRDTGRLVTVAQEMAFVESYVEIQKIRYPNQFYVLFDIEEEDMAWQIPPLLIQNYVENSIKYAHDDHQTEILVVVRRDGDRLRIGIVDDGSGMDAAVLEKIQNHQPIPDGEVMHVGIWNCRKRLELFYPGDSAFSISSAPGEGTCVWMEIPAREAEHEAADRG
ncbi:MAG: sensor histidine kinase [Lachnospiraceae bacterium]|nr:sensor histidine kinase [Lachnospiraceae bacterium]